jgi:hypothetical protein
MSHTTLPEGYDIVITLDDVPYYFKINRKTYRVSDLSAWTPRVGTGSVSRGDQDHHNGWEQITFHGGMGQLTMLDDTQYRYAENLDPRNEGLLTLFTQTHELPIPGLTGRPVMASDENYLYVGGTGGVWAWDGDTLTDIGLGLANQNVIGMFHNGEYLFVGLNDHRIHRFTGTVAAPTWASVGVTYGSGTNDFSARAFALYNGRHWHSQDGTNLLHWWVRGDGADAETGINTTLLDGSYVHPAEGVDYDPTAIEVGTMAYPIKALVPYGDWLYIFKQDSAWRLAPNGAGGYYTEQVFDQKDYLHHGQNYDAAIFDNAAIFTGHQNQFVRVVNKSETDLTPDPLTDDFPPTIHDRVQALYASYNWVFGLLSGQLYAHNGSFPHLLVPNVTDTVDDHTDSRLAGVRPAYMSYFSGHADYPVLVLAAYNSTDGYTSLYYWRISDRYSRAPYQETGFLETSSFSAGFVDVPKYWHSVKVEFRIPEDGGSIDIAGYSYNDGDITEYDLGSVHLHDSPPTVAGRPNRGFKTFHFPKTAEGKWLDLKFTLNRGASTDSTPILYSYVIEYVLRPPTIYGYAPQLLLSDGQVLKGNYRDALTTEQGFAAIEAIRDSVTPVYYVDYFGHRAWVYMATIVERDGYARNDDWHDSDAIVQTSFVMLERECNSVEVEAGESLVATGNYTVDCSITIEVSGSLTVEVA